jgi:hypothetical protein
MAADLETQVKIEIIRNDISTQAYARVSFYGIDILGFGVAPYNESNLLTGLNFGTTNSFVIHGTQIGTDIFTFSTLTVDKITAQ